MKIQVDGFEEVSREDTAIDTVNIIKAFMNFALFLYGLIIIHGGLFNSSTTGMNVINASR